MAITPSLTDLELAFYQAATSTGSGANAGVAFASNKVEDSVSASGDVGDFTLGIRNPAAPISATNANGDYIGFMTDAEGKQVVAPYAPSDYYWQTTPFTKTDTTDATVKASAGVGLRNYVTDVTVANTAVTAVLVNIKDGATIISQFLAPAGQTTSLSFAVPLKGTAATAVNIAAASAVTSLIINAQGYIGV